MFPQKTPLTEKNALCTFLCFLGKKTVKLKHRDYLENLKVKKNIGDILPGGFVGVVAGAARLKELILNDVISRT